MNQQFRENITNFKTWDYSRDNYKTSVQLFMEALGKVTLDNFPLIYDAEKDEYYFIANNLTKTSLALVDAGDSSHALTLKEAARIDQELEATMDQGKNDQGWSFVNYLNNPDTTYTTMELLESTTDNSLFLTTRELLLALDQFDYFEAPWVTAKIGPTGIPTRSVKTVYSIGDITYIELGDLPRTYIRRIFIDHYTGIRTDMEQTTLESLPLV